MGSVGSNLLSETKGALKSGEELHDRHFEVFLEILNLAIDLFDSEFIKTRNYVYEFLNQFITYLSKEIDIGENIMQIL